MRVDIEWVRGVAGKKAGEGWRRYNVKRVMLRVGKLQEPGFDAGKNGKWRSC